MQDHSLFVEKYRPQSVDSYVGNQEFKDIVSLYIAENDIQNLLLYGPAGTGKTSAAKLIVNKIECDYIYINASDERGIDTIREKVVGFASTMSFTNNRKYVILDEADYLNPQSTQPALRNFMEEFSSNCGFILTCSFKNRIIEPLHSRCSIVEFAIPKDQKPHLANKFFSHAKAILEDQNIEFDQKVLAQVITQYFPDWRRVLKELQR